jgi:thiamine biosynthesis lipoprotein
MTPPLPTAALAPAAANGLLAQVAVAMDTPVTVGIARGAGADDRAALGRALDWFRRVEAACSRFDPGSEVRRLLAQVGVPTRVSALLYEAVAFALAVAAASDGAFDPTIGARQERRGFARDYQTGATTATGLTATDDATAPPTYRDVVLGPDDRTITLRRPLVLDLGAVAKGLAIDLAMRELVGRGCGAIVEAGGDLLVRGLNPAGAPWHVGVRAPRHPDNLLMTLHLTDAAVCTSGDYERPAAAPGEHHLLDPQTGHSPGALASVTVVTPTAIAADALGTAAFVLGPRHGRRFLTQQGVAGLLVAPDLTTWTTPDFARLRA